MFGASEPPPRSGTNQIRRHEAITLEVVVVVVLRASTGGRFAEMGPHAGLSEDQQWLKRFFFLENCFPHSYMPQNDQHVLRITLAHKMLGFPPDLVTLGDPEPPGPVKTLPTSDVAKSTVQTSWVEDD